MIYIYEKLLACEFISRGVCSELRLYARLYVTPREAQKISFPYPSCVALQVKRVLNWFCKLSNDDSASQIHV